MLAHFSLLFKVYWHHLDKLKPVSTFWLFFWSLLAQFRPICGCWLSKWLLIWNRYSRLTKGKPVSNRYTYFKYIGTHLKLVHPFQMGTHFKWVPISNRYPFQIGTHFKQLPIWHKWPIPIWNMYPFDTSAHLKQVPNFCVFWTIFVLLASFRPL